ncbi:MAG: hypothetical protein ACREQ7_10115 [Candidatus Binatia bacterium]
MEKQQIASWIVPLLGHRFDLEDLPLWFAGQDVHVTQRDNGFVLVIPPKIVGDNYQPVRAFAEEQLELLNGIGRLLNPSFRSVSLSDQLYGIDASATVRHTVVAVGPAEMRVKAGSVRVVIGGKVQPDPAEAAASPLLVAASRFPRARDALIMVGRPHLTWSELYLLFELVEAEVGSQMFDRGWISRADAELFRRSANSYSVLRSDGRHGKDRGDPPTQPMAHGTALTLIRTLVLAWLRLAGAPDDERKAG